MKDLRFLIVEIAMVGIVVFSSPCFAGPIADIKEGARETISEIKDGAIKAGSAAVEVGKGVKKGVSGAWSDISDSAVHTGKAVKNGAVEVGEDIHNAYQETKSAIQKEVSSEK